MFEVSRLFFCIPPESEDETIRLFDGDETGAALSAQDNPDVIYTPVIVVFDNNLESDIL